ncbi:MAG: hypothetical protein ACFBSG_15260 [Leptolyngbyaceae cyanobacterium]
MQSQQLQRSLLGSLPLTLLSSLGATALATTMQLTVLPTVDSTGQCPAQLIAHETPRPYTEGSYSTDGMIKLREIANNVRVVQSDGFSTTWTATLNSEFRNCEGSAIIDVIDDVTYEGHSYLQVQLMDGQVTATLDMTGISDANGYTATLLFGGLRDGNPRWTWGGTD